MKRILSALFSGGVLVVLGVFLGQTGLLRFSGPQLPSLGTSRSTVASEDARIVAIEPVSLDCRARVHARVPVMVTRQHEILGRVYRTDTVTLDAVGDVDTCVDGTGTRVTHRADGGTEVVIDGAAITFVRPRVDAVATGDSLTVEQGKIGKLTDALPWVDDDLGLTPLAYAHAQNVIGSSRCMQAAFTVTEGLLVDAYRTQMLDQGADPERLSVRVEGEPAWGRPEPLDAGPGVELSAGMDDAACTVTGDSGGPDPAPRSA